ncbi:mechanosensitive ion channel family protein [Alteromonas sp. 5E99-2]|nr:mechanosensitive ion channel family protein [Alteromonas sp. 5E99-2]
MYLTVVTAILFIMAGISLIGVRLILNKTTTKWLLGRLKNWDQSLHSHKVFSRFAHLMPAIIISVGTYSLFSPETALYSFLMGLSKLYMLAVGLSVIYAIFNTIEHLYSLSNLAEKASITGFIQIGKLLFSIVTLLFCISILIGKSPLLLLSGLTAVAAVLLLIFRDTILGFVSGIQIAANQMFNTGDWIVMEKFGVDGEIIEIGLTNAKVQNWDNTISTLPTYALTNEAVKNWRGMNESGGRRIKRSIYLDIHCVRLCDEDMLATLSKIKYITPYIEKKRQELAQYHCDNHIDQQDLLNSRQLTNIGTFRAYLESYLIHHPMINTDMTTMVRHRAPSELGIPLEIYCFSCDKRWIEYEKIQADIFDHIMAMLPVFQLRAYQRDADLIRSKHTSNQFN